jgi:hypothetical protein
MDRSIAVSVSGKAARMTQEANLTEAEVSAIVRSFEERWDLFSKLVDGVCLWQLIRFEVSLRKQRGGLVRAPLSRKRLITGAFIGVLQYLLPSRHYHYLCKTYDSAHRGMQGDQSVDIYFDALCEEIDGGAKMSSYDAAGFEDTVARAKCRPVFDDTSLIVLSAVLGRYFPYKKTDPVFDLLAKALALEFGYNDYTAGRLARQYNVFRWRSYLYGLVLKKFMPVVVLAPDSGQFALMDACRNRKVGFVELQHGVFTAVHPNVLPKELPSQASVIKPSILAVYGNFTRDVLLGSALEADGRIEAVGAPFIERARMLRDSAFQPSEEVKVTITTQGVATEQLCQFVTVFLQNANLPMKIYIKLHPAYDVEEELYVRYLGSEPRVEIISGKSARSTHELIALSDLHLSISSASHYDALGIGTPTGIIPFETYQSVSSILQHEGAFLVDNPERFAAIVSRRGWPAVPLETRDHFFASGFVGNMKRVLQQRAEGNEATK